MLINHNRPFRSIDEQIQLLKSRNLQIINEKEASNFLLYKNYYNIINRYGQYFYDPGLEKFENGTTFDNLVDLYFFDNDLKHIFYRKLMKVESQFKSVLAHVFSKHHDEQFAYLNPNNFDKKYKDTHIYLVPKLSSQIKYNSNSNSPDNPIKHHMKKYGHVPFWVLINYLYFSDVTRFYSAMNKNEQNSISNIFFNQYVKEYSISISKNDKITPEQLDSFLRILNDHRNLIAHDNFLFGSKIKTLPKYCKCVYDDFDIESPNISRSLYSSFILMRVFLEFNTYKNLHNKVLKLVRKLAKNISQEKVNSILDAMGFPSDWNLYTKTIK